MATDTSEWSKQLAENYQSFVTNIGTKSSDWLRNRIMMAEVDMEDPVLHGEAEYCTAIISAAQAELAKRQ